MHSVTQADRSFQHDFEVGTLAPADFDHRAHLRLAYVHLADHGPVRAMATFRDALLAYLHRHGIDERKYHETLTQAWLQAVWHFMQRAGSTASGEEFLERSAALLDPRVMLTHYTRERLFGDEARQAYVEPDLDPIPRGPSPWDPGGPPAPVPGSVRG